MSTEDEAEQIIIRVDRERLRSPAAVGITLRSLSVLSSARTLTDLEGSRCVKEQTTVQPVEAIESMEALMCGYAFT